MWKPTNVVPEHQKRATAIWGALLLAILGYTVWQVTDLSVKYGNPSTNFSVSDEVYAFPPLSICLLSQQGCDSRLGDGSTCAGNAWFTVYDPCTIAVEVVFLNSVYTSCVALDLSSLDAQGFVDNGCGSSSGGVSDKPSATIVVDWRQSEDPENEGDYRESVYVLLGDEQDSEIVTVPYSRVISSADTVQGEVTVVEAVMTIGESTRKYISGPTTVSYPTTSLSTADSIYASLVATNTSTSSSSSYATGYLHITLTQGSYSKTELSDVNPFDVGSLLGNIGGFWELLLVVWGICFVASRVQSPTEKGRDFTQSIERGKEIVGRKRRRSNAQTTTTEVGGDGEEQPYWSAAGRGRQDGPGGSILVTPPLAGSGPSMDLDASVFRRPTPQDCPMRLVDNSSRSVMGSGSFVANGEEEATSQPPEAPSYAVYA